MFLLLLVLLLLVAESNPEIVLILNFKRKTFQSEGCVTNHHPRKSSNTWLREF